MACCINWQLPINFSFPEVNSEEDLRNITDCMPLDSLIPEKVKTRASTFMQAIAFQNFFIYE